MTASYNVFLSYASQDANHAEKLRRLLRARRDVRLHSTDEVSAGVNWRDELRTTLVNSDLFVLVVSPNSLHSSWLLQELGAAWTLDKPILAVVAGTTQPVSLPVELAEHQFASLRDFRKPEDFDRWLAPSEAAVAA